MTISKVIRPGDKIDIKLAKRAQQVGEKTVIPPNYKSKVLDIREDGSLEILMPAEKGKLIPLPLGVRFEFFFSTASGIYHAVGQITDRFKQENVYLMRIELKGQLEKQQRREFFRYSCLLDITYYTISQEEITGTGEALFVYLCANKDNAKREYTGQILDLSGGGTRFRTEQKLSRDQYLLMEIPLCSDSLNKTYYLIGTVTGCVKQDDGNNEIRVSFVFTDSNTQEEIIKYIFEEERKNRRKGKN